MSKNNKYLTQSNFFTRSIFNLESEVQKDIVYLIQSKIDFFGTVKDSIRISFDDYIEFKRINKKDTYSFAQFSDFAKEIKSIGGAFYNKINGNYVSFNIVDNIQISEEDPNTLDIQLGKFGKTFFYKEELDKYISDITPFGKKIKYNGYTQIENNVIKIKGFKRKKFFEILSQFKSTGYCKISLYELKMALGYIEIIDKVTKKPLQLELFVPENYEFVDKSPRFSEFERYFLKPAIKFINSDISKDINNLTLSNKLKSGKNITHLEFKWNALAKELIEEELKALKHFTELGLDESQIKFLLKRIGYKEMYGRYMKNIERRAYDDSLAKYYERGTKYEIKNMPGFLYKKIFTELHK